MLGSSNKNTSISKHLLLTRNLKICDGHPSKSRRLASQAETPKELLDRPMYASLKAGLNSMRRHTPDLDHILCDENVFVLLQIGPNRELKLCCSGNHLRDLPAQIRHRKCASRQL